MINMPKWYAIIYGPFKCYVTQMGVGGVKFSGKKRYKGVRFNVSRATRGWVGVQFPGNKRYVTLEWPLMWDENYKHSYFHSLPSQYKNVSDNSGFLGYKGLHQYVLVK